MSRERYATTSSLRMCPSVGFPAPPRDIPDDVVYWKVIGDHQQDLPLNEPLSREEGFLECNQPPYPEGTTLLLRRQGAEGDAATEVLGDLRAAKECASAQRKDKAADFKKAETAYYLRQQYFVEGLTGRARHNYDGILSDETLLAQNNLSLPLRYIRS